MLLTYRTTQTDEGPLLVHISEQRVPITTLSVDRGNGDLAAEVFGIGYALGKGLKHSELQVFSEDLQSALEALVELEKEDWSCAIFHAHHIRILLEAGFPEPPWKKYGVSRTWFKKVVKDLEPGWVFTHMYSLGVVGETP